MSPHDVTEQAKAHWCSDLDLRLSFTCGAFIYPGFSVVFSHTCPTLINLGPERHLEHDCGAPSSLPPDLWPRQALSSSNMGGRGQNLCYILSPAWDCIARHGIATKASALLVDPSKNMTVSSFLCWLITCALQLNVINFCIFV